jgi:hypothetical protein
MLFSFVTKNMVFSYTPNVNANVNVRVNVNVKKKDVVREDNETGGKSKEGACCAGKEGKLWVRAV